MEKTVTFNVTDALISPLGLAMLTGAGLADATSEKAKHVHVTYDVTTDDKGVAKIEYDALANEIGIAYNDDTEIVICEDAAIKTYATVLDHNGAVIGWVNNVTVDVGTAKKDQPAKFTVYDNDDSSKKLADTHLKLDFYVYMYTGVTEITIAPSDFGGTFYVEADTLYRNQDGKDMAATLTFPKAKIQSGFTISMSPTGDPSTFDFVMDAMPGYTYFDSNKKVVCDITIVGGASSTDSTPSHKEDHKSI